MSPSSTSSSEPTWAGYRDDELIPLCPNVRSGRLRRTVAYAVFLLFTALVLGGGAFDLIRPKALPPVIGREKEFQDRVRSSAKFADGTLAQLVEKDLRLKSAIRDAVLPAYSGILYRFFAEADPTQLVVGKDGWIFQNQRLNARPDPVEKLTDAPAALIAALDRRLAALGTTLVVVPIPRKEEIYRDQLRKPGLFPIRPELYGGFVLALHARGALASDLASIYRAAPGPTFLKTDTHWSALGIHLAAREAANLAGLLVPEADRKSAISRRTRPHRGDLARMGGIFRPDGTGWQAAAETIEIYDVVDPARRGGVDRTTREPGADCAVIGTSYTQIEDKFPKELGHHTDKTWWVGAWPAVGPVEPLRRGLKTLFGAGRSPKVLVWEVPTYEVFCLQAGLDALGPLIAGLPAKDWPSVVDDVLAPGGTPVAGWMQENRLVHPGDGSVSLRLRRRLAASAVVVGLTTETRHLSAEWPAGQHEITIPVVGDARCRKLHVTLTPGPGASGVALDDVALVTPLDLSTAAEPDQALPTEAPESWTREALFALEKSAGRLSSAVVDLRTLPPSAYPLSVSAEAAGSPAASATVDIGSGFTPHTVVIGLAALEGRQIRAIRVTGRGPDPGRVILRAAVGSPIVR